MKHPAISITTVAMFVASLFVVSGSTALQARQRHHRHNVEQARGAAIAVRPTNIKRGTSLHLTVTAPSGLDLSGVGVDRVAIVPSDDISHLEALHQNPGTNELTVGFAIDDSAALGPRTLIIFDANRVVMGSAAFNVLAVLADHCPGQEQCCATDDKTGLCNQCRPHCPVAINHCPAGKRCCEPGPACVCTSTTHTCP